MYELAARLWMARHRALPLLVLAAPIILAACNMGSGGPAY